MQWARDEKMEVRKVKAEKMKRGIGELEEEKGRRSSEEWIVRIIKMQMKNTN